MKKQKYTIMTVSVPKIKSVSKFKFSNTSSFYTDNFQIDADLFLIQMSKLNLYRFKVIIIYEDEKLIPDNNFETYSNSSYYPQQVLYILYLSQKEFFNLDILDCLFENEINKSFCF